MLFTLTLKFNFYDKGERSDHSFSIRLMNHLVQTSALFNMSLIEHLLFNKT